MRRQKRPVDWVANSESWDLSTPPIVLEPFQNVSASYAHSNLFGAMLTFHQDLVDNDNQFGVPQLEQTAVRVVGDIHYGLMAFASDLLPTVNVLLTLHFRIAVATQQPDALYAVSDEPGPAGGYNMDLPWVANDDFLWHHRVSTVLSNSFWTEELTVDWRLPQRLPVDVRVQRRLKQREVLVLFMQASQRPIIATAGVNIYNPWADLVLWTDPCLRTLVRTIT